MDTSKPRKGVVALAVVAVVCTAAILRSPITSVGALSPEIQADIGLTAAAMGLLTTLPLLAFAASALFMGRVAARLGKGRTLALGCAAVALGILARSLCAEAGLFAGTALLGIGISAGNVLIPAVVRERFPGRIGAMTATYTTIMCVFAGSAAGASSAIAGAGGDWKGILLWTLPMAVVACVLWIAVRLVGKDREHGRPGSVASTNGHKRLLPSNIAKCPLAWWITGMFGLQSILFYCVVAWIPQMLAAEGIGRGAISACVTLFPIMGIPCTLLLPPIAQRMRRQRLLGLVAGLSCALGVAMLLAARSDAFAVFAVAFLGLALGAPFCLCMYYFSVRTESPDDSASLSGAAQAFGYLLAAIEPTCLGVLHDLTGGWGSPIVVMCVLALGLALCCWKSGAGTIPSDPSADAGHLYEA